MEHEAEVVGVGAGSAPGGDVPAVVLAARGEYVPIFVSGDQARSIGLVLEGEPFERPLTHDLLLEVLTEFGGAVDRVRIDDLTDGTFYAKIDAQRYEDGQPEQFVFDARPSDALALAVRVECPIVVTDEVIDEAGRSPDSVTFGKDRGGDQGRDDPGSPGDPGGSGEPGDRGDSDDRGDPGDRGDSGGSGGFGDFGDFGDREE